MTQQCAWTRVCYGVFGERRRGEERNLCCTSDPLVRTLQRDEDTGRHLSKVMEDERESTRDSVWTQVTSRGNDIKLLMYTVRGPHVETSPFAMRLRHARARTGITVERT